ncbi:macrophage mannose receptor 1b [Eucyclogobius newberryi]|uniref:macrophage mannose receptor 1b n=1 Tax=Eucyclogobius newberryi TaxID=166745 RepID=UPI003B58D1A2
MGLIQRARDLWITLAALTVLIPSAECTNDSPFTLTNKATGFCLVKKSARCLEVRWTSGDRLFVVATKKCLGVQGKSAGSEVNFYDCDDRSELQKWECHNNTLLALKGQRLYVEVQADESVALSRNVGPNNHFTIVGTSSGACTRTERVLYTIGGNAFGKPCMFPFQYKDRWFGDCTAYDQPTKRPWCAIRTRHEREQWGFCPTTSNEHWARNIASGAYYQINLESALTWAQAQTSCAQQSASLLSIRDPNEQAFVSVLLGSKRAKVWVGLVQNPEHGWQWTDGQPFRYLRWSAGHPKPNPGHNCAVLDTSEEQKWESMTCEKQLGYICYKNGAPPPTFDVEQGFCASPWIPYSGHCFHLHREPKTWSDAVKECRKETGDLLSIRHVEDQSFVLSQLGYAATDELWIGLNDRRTEGFFEWVDQSAVTFSSWTYGEPSVFEDSEDCALMTGENGNWADRSCEEKHGFICSKQSSTEQTGEEINLDVGCKPGWKRHGSYCYFVGTATKTFDEATEDCKGSGSYLADVSNGVDNAFLVSLVGMRPEKYFWIGLSNTGDVDRFVWRNTEQVQFTHWNRNMPGYQQGCVAMTTGVMAGLWDLLPCTNKEKYICKHLAEGAIVTQPSPTLPPPKCPDGWVKISSRNYCAKFFTGPRAFEKTWFEAREYCRDIGGDLLSFHSVDELRIARHGKAWIGLHVPDANSGYVWSDGSPVNFLHWEEGEPNNFNNVESCVEYKVYHWDERGSWNDAHCDSYNDWFCQIRTGVTPKPPRNNTVSEFNKTADGWLEWRGNQYYINSATMAMEEASNFCKQRHGELVTITSRAENVFIWKQISRSYGRYFIGLSVDYDGSFWWKDNTPVEFLSWDDKQPNENAIDERCVVMTYFMGFWSNCNCGAELKSICKRSSSAPVNTTVAPTMAPAGGCPPTWTQFNSKCYSIINNKKSTWEDARRHCMSIEGNLASIPSRNIQVFLTTRMTEATSTDLWIGLNSIKQDEFYWTDGKSRKYTNWGYPKNKRRPGSFYQRWNEEDCVALSSNPMSFGKWVMKSCNDTNGYICLRGLVKKHPSQPYTILPDTYISLANDSIKLITQNRTWDDARANCEKQQANLASLRNEWTQSFVELMAMTVKAPLWIGLNKKQTNGFYRYIDGWYMKFATWAEGEPQQDKPCVYMDVDGKWKTAFCNTTMKSVCLQTTDVAPTHSSEYPGVCPEETEVDYRQSHSWIPYKGHCYLFVSAEVEWADAASNCARQGGTLASIEDPAEQEFIETNVKVFKDAHSSFWVGLFKSHKGTWQWLDKKVMDYTNWADDQPRSDYGEIQSADGKWNTGRRWHDRAFICKAAKVIPSVDGKAEPLGPQESKSRTHRTLAVVLVILVVSGLVAAAIFYYKRSPNSLPTFVNPLYTERSQPDVVDTKTLIEKGETEEETENSAENNTEPIINL